jgi:hypothetical protein
MALPVLVAVGAGIASGLATGYVIDKTLGDGNYTRNEMVTDAILGAAGIGMLRHGGRLAKGHAKYASLLAKHYDPAVDTVKGLTMVYLMKNGNDVYRAGKSAATIVAVGNAVEVIGGQSLPSRPKPVASAQVSKYKSGKISSKRSKKKSRKFTPMRPQYCASHKKYDYCYRK